MGWVYDTSNQQFSFIGGANDNTVVAQGVNNAGQVVGSGTFFPSTVREGFIYDTNTGTRTRVSVPGFEDRNILPRAINDVGQVAGSIGPTAKVFFGNAGNFRTVDIAGGTVAYIYGNNDVGNFVGFYIDAGGRYHGFVLSKAAAP